MRKKLLVVINFVIAALTVYAYLYMYYCWSSSGALSNAGIESLKYFTVLSNLLEGAASLIAAVFFIKGTMPRWLMTLKYAAAVAVGLTFFTVLFFLGLLYGYASMYNGANFYFHLLIPLIAMVEYVAFSEYDTPNLQESLLALIPMVLYGAFYLSNLLINGIPGNDWYGFAQAGFPAGYFVFAFIGAATWGLALLMRLLKKMINKKALSQNSIKSY